MNNIPAQAAMGWGRSPSEPREPVRTRVRDVVPPLGAVVVLTIAHLLFGAVQPIAALSLSAVITAVALVVIALAGPRHVTAGMIAGSMLLALYGLTGLAGPLERAAPHLAVLFAAGAMWTVGYISARLRGSLDALWSGLIWGSITYCAWMFIANVSAAMATPGGSVLAASFETPGAGSLLFGLFALIGLARILHVIKQMDAEGLARPQMVERLLREGFSGILLIGLSITCLVIIGSNAGMVLTAGALIAHAWWDTLSITARDHRGILTRLLAFLAPFVAIALMGAGVGLGWLQDETVAPGVGLANQLPNAQRLQAFMAAWAQQPAFGHGLGSIDAVGAQATTLFNAKAMLAPGHAHNVFVTWLAETGIVGLSLLVLALTAMHARIFTAIASRKTPRTFLRLSIVAGLLVLLHGVADYSVDLPSIVWLYALLLGAACGVATGRRLNTLADDESEET